MRKALDTDFRVVLSIKQEYEEVIKKFSSHKSMKKILEHYNKQQELKKATKQALADCLEVSELPPKPSELLYLKNVRALQSTILEDQNRQPTNKLVKSS